MRRSLALLLFLIFSMLTFDVFAQRVAKAKADKPIKDASIKTFVYDGQGYERLRLKKVKVETKQECHDVTKYREEKQWVSSQQECSYRPSKKVCKIRKGKKVCKTVGGGMVCDAIPGYYKYVPVPYIEKVCAPKITTRKRVVATVEFNFDYTKLDPNIRITAELKQNGNLKISTKDKSFRPIILLAEKTKNQESQGNTIRVEYVYNVKAVKLARLIAPIKEKASNLMFEYNRFMFQLGKVRKPNKLEIHLKLIEESSGKVVIDRVLNKAKKEYSFEKMYDGKTLAMVNLKRLGLKLNYGYYRSVVKVKLKMDKEILSTDHPKLFKVKREKVFNNWDYSYE